MSKIQELVKKHIYDIYNPDIMFELGYEYEKENQLASALSFYLKASEYYLTNNIKDLCSISLYKAGCIYFTLGDRFDTTEKLFLYSIELNNNLIHVYLKLTRLYEQYNKWHNCLFYCNLGIKYLDNYSNIDIEPRDNNDLKEEFFYQRAIANYKIGRCDIARIQIVNLLNNSSNSWIKSLCNSALKLTGYPKNFKESFYQSIILNNELVDIKLETYSQCFQDLIINDLIPNPGFYLEIGSADPIINSNSYLLEKKGWKGISIDIDVDITNKFKTVRKNFSVCTNALDVNYKQTLENYDAPVTIDFLQIDCDPAKTTYEILLKIPLDDYKFNVITFEHDSYLNSGEYRDLSREYLLAKGYKLLIKDLTHNCKEAFEDIWVHSDYYNNNIELVSKYDGLNHVCPLDLIQYFIK